MNDHQRRLADYLGHILRAIERIGSHTKDIGEAAFMENQMARDAVLRNLEIIGEASHKIEVHCRDLAADHPELPLTFADQMRSAGAHGPFKVDLEIVWRTIHRDLPGLYQQVRALAQELSRDERDSGLEPSMAGKPLDSLAVWRGVVAVWLEFGASPGGTLPPAVTRRQPGARQGCRIRLPQDSRQRHRGCEKIEDWAPIVPTDSAVTGCFIDKFIGILPRLGYFFTASQESLFSQAREKGRG